jgi:membrane protease YdiL (CAAX protease family)
MAEMLEQQIHPSGHIAGARTRRVWVILIAAPLLWPGLWLMGVALRRRLNVEAMSVAEMLRQFHQWIILAAEIGLFILVVLWLRRAGRRLADIGLKADWLGREAVIGLLAGLSLWALGLAPLWLLGFRELGPTYWVLLVFHQPIRLLYLIVIAVCEEVIWRGYAITELHRLYRLSASVFIAIFGFAAFHLGEAVLFDWLILPLMLYVGGWLSLLYLWRQSLVAPMVAHVVLDLLGFI